MRRWIVRFGQSAHTYYTWYHADQFCRALSINGTPYTLEELT